MPSLDIMISLLGDVEAMETLGRCIRDQRLSRNFSQAYVAAIVGITLPTYRKIEAGEGNVEFRHVVRTLGVFGYCDALKDLLPAVSPALTRRELLNPVGRKRASRSRRRP